MVKQRAQKAGETGNICLPDPVTLFVFLVSKKNNICALTGDQMDQRR
jgi:hypothetical protein